jgi:hypothetical protein
MGVVAFASPSGNSCDAAKLSDIATSGVDLPQSDEDADLQAAADKVNTAISTLVPSGGTPTAASLSMLATYTGLQDPDPNRLRLVLLLTDGLPNCNPQNPNNQCTAVNAVCQCTSKTPTDCDPGRVGCSLSCTDKDASVLSIQALQDREIKTVVVGFGAETGTGNAPNVLNAMAEAGAFSRTCPNGTDAECNGGPSGDPNDGCLPDLTCKKKYYQADTGDALGKALEAIVNRVANPCTWTLDMKPNDPALLSVLVDGVSIPSGPTTWSYSAGDIVFVDSGDICQRLKASTPANPVNLAFQVLNAL